jgi:hypothetical protein
MSYEIEKVVTAIQNAGGKIRPSELVRAFDKQDKRTIQRAVQSALDQGIIKLDGDMRLVVGSPMKVAEAA